MNLGGPHVGFTCGAFDLGFEFSDVRSSVSDFYDSHPSSIHKIDRDQPSLTSFIRYEAAPCPFTRSSYESPFHWIGVHVLDLLSNLLRAIYVEVIKPRLPEPCQFRVTLFKCKPHLSRRHMPFLPSQIPRNALFQHSQHQRRRRVRALANKQVNMLRHHHISHQQKSIPIANGSQRLHECIPSPRSSQERQPPVTTKRQKMEIAPSIIPLESSGHRTTPKTPTRNTDVWGTPPS